MNKKVITLISSSLLALSLTGCNTSVTLFGKEIFSAKDNTQIEQQEEETITQEQRAFDEQEVLSWLLNGDYTLTVDGRDYVYNTEHMLNIMFDNKQEYKVDKYSESEYLIQAISENQDRFVTFVANDNNLNIEIVEFYHNGYLYEGNDASQMFSQVVYKELFNEKDGTLTKKQQTTKEEKKQSETKQKKKTEVKKTCKWCNDNQLPSGSGDNDKCQECQEEWWNYECHDCAKQMTLDEYWQTSGQEGFCPACYNKYLNATSQTDHKTYFCDRCGKDITGLNFLQNFTEGGYNFDFICEGCLLDLGY